jgi:RNA polymerase sigma-70 factor (ECF subfamily)
MYYIHTSNQPELIQEGKLPLQDGACSMSAQMFGHLYDKHRERLLNTITVVVRNRDNAEDITAVAFEAAFENLSQLRCESSFYPWVRAIALNEVRNRVRRQRGVLLESFDTPGVKELVEPGLLPDRLEQSECCARIRKALRQLPCVYRRTLTDHFVRGHSVKQIARRSGVPIGTVLSRIFSAKRLLRRALGVARNAV